MNGSERGAASEGSFSRTLLRMCLPTVVIMLVLVVYNMADTWFVCRAGDVNQVAALSLCGPLFAALTGVGTLLGSGGCTAVSLALGRNDGEDVGAVTAFCQICALGAGAALGVAGWLFREPIARFLGAEGATLSPASQYVGVIALGAPIILYANIFANIARADGSAMVSLIANGSGTLANIALDALFILVFRWNAPGAALATVLGNALTAALLAVYIRKKRPCLIPRPRALRGRGALARHVIALGLPLAVSTLLSSLSGALGNRLLTRWGAEAIAAHGVCGKFGMLAGMLVMGVCMGMQPAFSYASARGDSGRLRYLATRTALFATALGGALAALCYILREPILAAFVSEADVVALAAVFLPAALLTGPLCGPYHLLTALLQASGNASGATLLAVLDKGALYAPALLLGARLFGLYGVAWAGVASLVGSLAVGLVLLPRWRWILPSRDC